jgi:hypothetical protein
MRGIEFAEISNGEMRFGLTERRPAHEHHTAEIAALAAELNRARSPQAADREHPLFRQSPEAWLESQARAAIQTLDASLLADPVYGQTPVFAGGERGVVDLLAVDRTGRLAIVELKASADIHLPLQALDYWIHVSGTSIAANSRPRATSPASNCGRNRRASCWSRRRSNSTTLPKPY